MPWRKPWIDLAEPEAKKGGGGEGRQDLQRRAYEVWISEIMLQQTRVETVRKYWLAWMDKWPTIEALAHASVDDVLSAWRGLGYYGRARRIHEAAQKVMNDSELQGQLPEYASELSKHIPGVGPYTAGAISSIVFGHATPILDGNIARVLCRQAGLYADPRAKSTTDLQWELARMLVEAVSPDRPSGVPGRWNQGLMELGSTHCTPTNPGCETCPIQATCAAYIEGQVYEKKGTSSARAERDIEDLCTICQPLPDPADAGDDADDPPPSSPPRKKKLQQMTLMGTTMKTAEPKKARAKMASAIKYAQLFPMRIPKQAPRTEHRLVCIVRTTGKTPRYLLVKRPDQGLLASLWEFPTTTLNHDEDKDVSALANAYIQTLAIPPPTAGDSPYMTLQVNRIQSLGTVRHEFSHLHWLMYAVLVDVTCHAASGASDIDISRLQWQTTGGVEAASMGTGLRRCWSLVPTDEPCQ
ncbi:a g-specific adenine glycosylase [Malassezia pachydermatis]|uniref:Adenine DNA glycosylase n=1 Tax=Malassezia pachydermatis TaxID=77020 RepID=A0A0M8MXA0_9BASI|nr:a g-specific adenine glycosylase [Malassezia pachydermatis]KOS15391.1 a g-specific adenine glycosylase [Malassezia pachydermatis]